MEELSGIALTVSAVGLLFSAVATFASLKGLMAERARRHTLELTVDGGKIAIDLDSIGREDTRKLESALETVRAAKPRELLAA